MCTGEEVNSFSVGGDFRYRHEWIDSESNPITNRHRLRLRLDVEFTATPEVTIFSGLSSGSDDPVSNNQTLGDDLTVKDIRLSQAYLRYHPKAVMGLEFIAGKFKNQIVIPGKSELIWDSDLYPEGMMLSIEREVTNVHMDLSGGGYWIEENKENDDVFLLLVHLQTELKVQNGPELIGGGGYYHYYNVAGLEPFYGKANGNTLSDGKYAFEYHLAEAYAGLKTRVGRFPLLIIADGVLNTAIGENRTGWVGIIEIGKVKEPGSWKLRYNFRRIESDAVVGIFADSDFIGGGSDGRGHEINAELGVLDKTSIAVTYFNNKKGLQAKQDFQRFQLDIKVKF
jgi:hypothetical protein